MHLADPKPENSKSERRALPWSHPEHIRYPKATEIALSRAAAASATPHCALYRAIFDGAPVPGKERERAKRSDGGMNVLTLLQTVIAAADIASGYVATPTGESRWQRKTYYDLDGLAYGPQIPNERSFRRTERAAAQLAALGLVRVVPWRVRTVDGVRSIPAAKFVTEKCWRMLGAWAAVRAERRRRDRAKGEARVIEMQQRIAAMQRPTAASAAAVPPQAPVTPPAASAVGPPDRGKRGESAAGTAAIATIRALLKD